MILATYQTFLQRRFSTPDRHTTFIIACSPASKGVCQKEMRTIRLMRSYTQEELRKTFSSSSDFNEIFDAFQYALSSNLRDIEPYKLLFYNHSLTPDEVRLFGEKLSSQFPDLSYEVYIWLASVFEVTNASNDNYELALYYYKKASEAKPSEVDPYLDACDCYEPDLNIPPLGNLIDFVKTGIPVVAKPRELYRCLAQLYELSGNPEEAERCRRKGEQSLPPQSPSNPA